MNRNCPNQPTSLKHLSSLELPAIAKATGWLAREGGKICAEHFCSAIVTASSMSKSSLSSLALLAHDAGARSVSKQAMAERVNPRAVDMLESVLANARASKAAPGLDALGFGRILLQDSTTIALPRSLHEALPGAGNGKGETAAVKVNATLDLRRSEFEELTIRSARESDQGHSAQGAQVVREGDLLLRDLGYFSLDALACVVERGADFVTRWLPHTTLADPGTLGEIDLPTLLADKESVDAPVLAGSRKRLECRLLAFRVPIEVAAQRRCRLRRDTLKRSGGIPSKRLLALQDWQIYLTSCPREKLSARQARGLYSQRWAIEIAFKGLKSHLRINAVAERASASMAQCLVLGALIRAVFVTSVVLPALRERFPERDISLLKLMRMIETIGLDLSAESWEGKTDLAGVIRHCCYEKRKRKSLAEKLRSLA